MKNGAQTLRTCRCGSTTITYHVTFRKRKTLGIQVEAPDQVRVTAPLRTPEVRIKEVVENKSKWILEKLAHLREREAKKERKQFLDGERFHYLGERYPLDIVHDGSLRVPEVKLVQDTFCVLVPNEDPNLIRSALENWYRERALDEINQRVAAFQPLFQVQPTAVKVKTQQKRWGSCTSRGNLLFNWKLIMAPGSLLDYVVVHEMCHLVHLNHSKAFWQLVEKVMPDYQKRRQALRDQGIKFDWT
ncbi:MAG: SprT family zinc-dependent metalloprotease [Bacillota bacterium]|nr:SprT family zinc-dependent metalloprotease [Bacillota bacterium]